MLKTGVGSTLKSPSRIRYYLVGFQFVIAVFLLLATLALYLQLSLLQQRDLGMNPRNLYAIGVSSEEVKLRRIPLLNAFRQIPGVTRVALNGRRPNSYPGIGFRTRMENPTDNVSIDNVVGSSIGYGFFTALEIPLLAGREFDPALDYNPTSAPGRELEEINGDNLIERFSSVPKMIINRTTARLLGYDNPEDAIGRPVRMNFKSIPPYEIIGVVEDSLYYSVDRGITPEAYRLSESEFRYIFLRYDDSVAGTIDDSIESIFHQIAPDSPFQGFHMENRMLADVLDELRLGRLLIALTLLSVFISCLGLYAMVELSACSREKEIGVRKVLGADTWTILKLFARQFSWPVLAANVVAWPLAYMAISLWLLDFPVQIDKALLYPLFIVIGMLTLGITFLTVSLSIIRKISGNPGHSLRYE